VILTRQRRAPVVAVVVAICGLLLTGCGDNVGVHPGSAAVVDGQSLSMNKIDDTTKLYCQAYVAQSQQSQQTSSGPIPMGVVPVAAVETPADAADASDDRITH